MGIMVSTYGARCVFMVGTVVDGVSVPAIAYWQSPTATARLINY